MNMNPSENIIDYIEYLESSKDSKLYLDSDTSNIDKLRDSKVLVTNVNIGHAPRFDSLVTLVLEVGKKCEIYSFKSFPKLKELKIFSIIDQSIMVRIEFPKSLKALVLHNLDQSSLKFLNDLPNLEKLDLRFNSLDTINYLDGLTGLKLLELADNNLENLYGLERLKNLQFLNLENNNISDIRILNEIPSLQFVNISGNQIDKLDSISQLERPEIAVFADRPGEWQTYTGCMHQDFVDFDYDILESHL